MGLVVNKGVSTTYDEAYATTTMAKNRKITGPKPQETDVVESELGIVYEIETGLIEPITVVRDSGFSGIVFEPTGTKARVSLRTALVVGSSMTAIVRAEQADGVGVLIPVTLNGISAYSRENLEDTVKRALFSANEPGFMYDLADFSSLRQDSIGTTPVTAVGQPLGLVLDKSKGMALGAELRGNGVLVPQGAGTGTYDTETGEATLNRVNVSNRMDINVAVPLGSFVLVDVEVTSGVISVRDGPSATVLAITTPSRRKFICPNIANSLLAFVVNADATTTNLIIHSVRVIAGNHAYQPTAASRPILGRHPITGLRNVATGSANVGPDTNWRGTATQNGLTATKIASGIDLDGLPYVDVRYQGTTTGASHSTAYDSFLSRVAATSGQTYTSSAYMQLIAGTTANHLARVAVVEETAPGTYVGATASAAATAVETLLPVSRALTTGNQFRAEISLTFSSGAVIDATYRIKGLQFELGSTRTAYQFNYTSFDTTEPGVASAYYASFDGVDDFLVTNTITPGIDKAQTFIGLRKLSDASRASLVELSTSAGNAGTFMVEAPSGAFPDYGFNSGGSLPFSASARSVGFAAPITDIVTGLGDISGRFAVLRVDGVSRFTATNDQGTGNYLAYPAYIGRRGGTSLPFNGRIYSLICRFGPNLSNYIIGLVEAYTNSKTGAYENYSLESLFSAGEPGLLLDFADFSTLFQDAAGTTPVTTVGQPIGLALDKSKGLAIGPELRDTGTVFVSGTGVPGTYNTTTGVGTAPRIDVFNRSDVLFSGLVSGTTYIVDVENTGTAWLTVRTNAIGTVVQQLTAGQRFNVMVQVVGGTLSIVTSANDQTANFTIHSIRQIAGNHASQPTAASRPILGRNPIVGTRNVATGSANVGPATNWPATYTVNSITSTKVASGIDPLDGLPYVDVRYQRAAIANTSGHVFAYETTLSRIPASSGQTYTTSAYVRLIAGTTSGHRARVAVVEETAPGNYIAEGPSEIASATETLLVGTRTVATGNQVRAQFYISPDSGVAIDATYRIKGLQFELGSARTTYQYNYNSFDITEPNVPSVYYAAFDGVDDFLVTNVITPGTDKAQIFAGVRKLGSDAATGILLETSVDGSNNSGTILLAAPSGPNTYMMRSRGTINGNAVTATNYPPPITDVLTGLGDIAADLSTLRVDGSQIAQVTTDQGSSSYLAYPIYIGRRGGTTFPFNGRIYSLALRFGPNLTTDRIAGTERTVNLKTGAF
jgi:hypothetical protein